MGRSRASRLKRMSLAVQETQTQASSCQGCYDPFGWDHSEHSKDAEAPLRLDRLSAGS
jgi:hypothetical protein